MGPRIATLVAAAALLAAGCFASLEAGAEDRDPFLGDDDDGGGGAPPDVLACQEDIDCVPASATCCSCPTYAVASFADEGGACEGVLCPGMVTSTLWKAAERRPDELGGRTDVPPEQGAMMEQHGMPAEEVGARVIEGLKNDAFFIMTHAHVADIADARATEAASAFAAQVPRYDGDDRYDVNKVMAKVMGGGDA